MVHIWKKKIVHSWGLGTLNMQKHLKFMLSFEDVNFAMMKNILKK
jgi:hypothetical protein